MIKIHKIRLIFIRLFMGIGISMIILPFIVFWARVGAPGFGIAKTSMLIIGILFFGISFLLQSRLITDKQIEKIFILFQQILPADLKDIKIASFLLALGYVIGTLYVFSVWPQRTQLFYPSTTATTVVPLHPYLWFINPYGFFFGSTIALSYAIFRLGMKRLFSIICALSFMLSSNHLYNLVPSVLRDYAKAPFILAIVFITGLLVKFPFNRNRLLGLSITAGVVLGLGFWIRQDMVIFVLPFVVVLFLFLPGSILAQLKIKIIALCLFIIGFALLASFRFNNYMAYAPHRALCGFMKPFDSRLGIISPSYDWGYQFSDEFAYSIAYSQARAITPNRVYSFSWEKEYDSVASDYIFRIVKNFPADALTRVYGAILNILELPFLYVLPPVGINNFIISSLYAGRASILNSLAGLGVIFVVLSLLFISAYSLRKAFFCLFLLVFLAGYPVLQFSGRHYFHLEFISLWFLSFIAQQVILFFRQYLIHLDKFKGLINIKRAMGFAVTALIIFLLPLFLLSKYQSRNISSILNKYAKADTERLPLSPLSLSNNKILFTVHGKFKPLSQRSLSVDYLVAEFDAQSCGYSKLWPTLRYELIPSDRVNFSRTIEVELSKSDSKSKWLFFPAISFKDVCVEGYTIYFQGIEMPNEEAACLRGLYRIKDPSRLPILLTTVFPLPGNNVGLSQKLALWRNNIVYTIAKNMPLAEKMHTFSNKIDALTVSDIVFKADIAHITEDRKWAINGYADPRFYLPNIPLSNPVYSTVAKSSFADINIGAIDTDLLKTKAIWRKKGSFFVAEGKLYAGGVTFSIIRDGRVSGYVNVTSRGLFSIAIEVLQDGLYSFGLANNLDAYTSLENRLVINKIGWIAGI